MPASDRSVIPGREQFAFEEDTAVQPGGENLYLANITDRWSIGGRPNGGYLMGTILRSLTHRLAHPDPLTSTGHFLSPAEPGPAEIKVNVIKEGRSLSTALAVLSQNGRERLVSLATFGVLADEGVSRVAENAPTHSNDLVSSIGRPIPFPIVERFEFEMPPEQARAAAGQPDHTNGRPSSSEESGSPTGCLPSRLHSLSWSTPSHRPFSG